jgi:hypothetical protein
LGKIWGDGSSVNAWLNCRWLQFADCELNWARAQLDWERCDDSVMMDLGNWKSHGSVYEFPGCGW